MKFGTIIYRKYLHRRNLITDHGHRPMNAVPVSVVLFLLLLLNQKFMHIITNTLTKTSSNLSVSAFHHPLSRLSRSATTTRTTTLFARHTYRGHRQAQLEIIPSFPFDIVSNKQQHDSIRSRSLSKRYASMDPNQNDSNNDNNWNQESSSSSAAAAASSKSAVEPQLYSQRWVQLIYLSLLALLSDWICFSVAAVPDVFESIYGMQISAPSLIDIFLITNVISSFLVTDVVAKIGLQRAIQASAVLMTIGCWLRSGFDFVPFIGTPNTSVLVTYPFVVLGTILVGISQPFFQCTPPLLSATWFAPSERATSTAIALNFNQIGIATAFLVGGAMATDRTGLARYMGLIAFICTTVTVGTIFQFQNEPPIPPSISEIKKKEQGMKEPPFRVSVQRLFQKSGFKQALVAFICSISITNVIGAFIDEIMERGGIVEQLSIDLAGAGFEVAILLGGILIGGYVDRSKQYKNVTLACLAVTAIMVIPLGLTDHQIGKEPLLLILSLLMVGLAAGPIQPINAELAVDVTYPCDETAVESVQQIGGNMISALLIPVADWASRRVDYEIFENIPPIASDVRGDVILLLVVALITMAYYQTFNAPLERSFMDGKDNDDSSPSESSSIQVDNGLTSTIVYIESTTITEVHHVQPCLNRGLLRPMRHSFVPANWRQSSFD